MLGQVSTWTEREAVTECVDGCPTSPARSACGEWSALAGGAFSCDGQRRHRKNNLDTVVA